MDGRDFEDLVVGHRIRYTKEDIYRIAGQLLNLIEVLHDNNVVHQDIRLPNVIVKRNMELALIDFGLARFIDGREYVPQIDYWYLGDFLIHLYYTSYESTNDEDKAWYEELDLSTNKEIFLKKLMGIEEEYDNIQQIKEQLGKIKTENNNIK